MHPGKLYERYCELQRYIGWTDDDARRVLSLAPLVERHFALMIDDFYIAIQQNSSAMKVITGGAEQIQRLKGTLVRWLQELFSGCYDRAYVERRWKVGLKHVDIGLEQVYTNAALSRLRNKLLAALETERLEGESQMSQARSSLNKLIDLDLAIIEEAYRTEQQRRQQRIERLATIGQVAGGIAHELRNPLNVIKTSVYYLKNAHSVSPEKRERHLDRIDRQANMADGVITALNNFARLPLPDMRPVSVAQLIQDSLDANSLPQSFIAKIEIAESAQDILGDPQQLLIVVTNLVRNARDAMPEGGILSFTAVQSGNSVEIQVTDTGIGIQPENLGRIMEPLYSTKARGIGLGLAISRAIIEKHQGDLKVRTEVGQGTTFTLRLPRADQDT